jgi:hypothetical protein
MTKEKVIPIGLAKVAGRHRCKHPLKLYEGQRTGTLDSSWNDLLRDLKEFGESFQRPAKSTKAARRGRSDAKQHP